MLTGRAKIQEASLRGDSMFCAKQVRIHRDVTKVRKVVATVILDCICKPLSKREGPIRERIGLQRTDGMREIVSRPTRTDD